MQKIITYIEDPKKITDKDIDTAVFLNAIVLHVINISSNPQNIKSNRGPEHIYGINCAFFITLCQCLLPNDRRTIFGALLDQMRYPNSHTLSATKILICLFKDTNNIKVHEQVTKILIERLLVSKPHPWGLQILYLEIYKEFKLFPKFMDS